MLMGQAAAIFEMMRTLIGAGGDLSWGHAMSHMAGMSSGVVTGIGDGNHTYRLSRPRGVEHLERFHLGS